MKLAVQHKWTVNWRPLCSSRSQGQAPAPAVALEAGARWCEKCLRAEARRPL